MRHYTEPYLMNPAHAITVGLVGLGGTGSNVLRELARINEALIATGSPGLHVRAWDTDSFTAANVGRQNMSPADFGVNKATVLITRVNRYYGYNWEGIEKKYTGKKDLSNIIITCVDTAAARVEIGNNITIHIKEINGDKTQYRHLHDAQKPYYWLDFGNDKFTGQAVIGTLIPVKQPKIQSEPVKGSLKTVLQEYPQLRKMKSPRNHQSCSAAEALDNQDLFINSLISQWGCQLLWQLLKTGYIENRAVFVNSQAMSVAPLKITAK
jgi:PRTRC genetic system ThiF family protein